MEDINSEFSKLKGKEIKKLEDSIRMTEDVAGKRLMEVIGRVPVYLVNEGAMDCICPPRKYLSAECLSQVLGDFDPVEFLGEIKNGYQEAEGFLKDVDRKLDELERRIEKCRRERAVSFHALGCYVSTQTAIGCFEDENVREVLRKTKKAIFICPERIHKHSEELDVPPDVYFTSVLLHEFAHAYLDDGSPSPSEVWEDVWSEGLANSIAYESVFISPYLSKSRKNDFIAYMTKIVSHEPPEYRTSLLLVSDPDILIAAQKIWISSIYQDDIPHVIEKLLRDPRQLRRIRSLIYYLNRKLIRLLSEFPYRAIGYRTIEYYGARWMSYVLHRYGEELFPLFLWLLHFLPFPFLSLFYFYVYPHFLYSGELSRAKKRASMTSPSIFPFHTFLNVWKERKENIYRNNIISKYRKLLFKLLALYMLKRILRT